MKSKEEMFESCKQEILKQARNTKEGEVFFDGTIQPQSGWSRYCVIEYRCSFPKLDPVEMAAELIKEGIKIYFDDSSISKKENWQKENKVKKLLEGIYG